VVVTCPSCSKKNRVAAEHLTDRTRCGACKTELPFVSTPLEADEALFDEITSRAKVPVLVDFWAEWCGPCRAAAPEVKKTAEDLAGRALVLKVDTERHPALAARFRVQSIPNFVVMKEGRVVLQQPGLVPSARMKEWLLGA
jgi:thioredoxin 2